MRNAHTLSRCHAARSSRTTTATLVSKSVTAIRRHDDGPAGLGLGRSCVARGRHADRPPEDAREVRLVVEPAGRRDLAGGSPAASSARARATRKSSWKACGGSPTCARNVRASSNRESPATAASSASGTGAAQRSSRYRRARRTAACSSRVRRDHGPGPGARCGRSASTAASTASSTSSPGGPASAVCAAASDRRRRSSRKTTQRAARGAAPSSAHSPNTAGSR